MSTQDARPMLDMSAKFGATTFSNYEIYMIGEALVRSMGTVFRVGHASPASSLDYLTNPKAMDLGTLVVRDYIAWTSGRTHMAEGCVERMRELVETSNLEEELCSALNLTSDQVAAIVAMTTVKPKTRTAGLSGQTARSARRAS